MKAKLMKSDIFILKQGKKIKKKIIGFELGKQKRFIKY